MSGLSIRKLHSYEQILHNGMVAVPFFYSEKQTKILATRNVPIDFLLTLQTPIHQHIYFKNNKPITTYLMEFESVETAIVSKNKIQSQLKDKSIKFICQFAKQVSDYNGILFTAGRNYVTFPETKEMKEIIDTIAQAIVMNGVDFQQKLKLAQQPVLAFLNERTLSLQHNYYRWRVYSYMQGDGDKKFRQEPFQIVRNGLTWYPPLSNSAYPSVMNLKQVKYLTECLQRMERKKYTIEEVMIFAIHNINYAVHISLIIMIHLLELLKSDFIGTMFLISDILFNSQNHIYRNLFQSRLPFIINSYLELRQTDQTGMMNDKYLTELKRLFDVWEKKFVFDEGFMKGLIFMLENPTVENMYVLCEIPEHPKVRQIVGGDHTSYELEQSCLQNGIPFFENKEYVAKIYLNALFWKNDKMNDIEPSVGKNDGDPITEKQLQKIQTKSLKVVSCQNLPLSMLFDKNWKPLRTSHGNLSQDGLN